MFASMHDFRWEIIIEGSEDGKEWKQYLFKYKVNSADDNLRFLPLYYWPRLDWMIWFLPLRISRSANVRAAPPTWFKRFIVCLLENNKDVCNLLEHNPFREKAPKYIRALIYDYKIKDKTQQVSEKPQGQTTEAQLRKIIAHKLFHVPKELQQQVVGEHWIVTGPVVVYVPPSCLN